MCICVQMKKNESKRETDDHNKGIPETCKKL